MAKPTTVRWGIMATGGIARTFTKDLLIDPKTRDVSDVVHVVSAAASSTSKASAEKFISELVVPKQAHEKCTAYGSYEELVKDPDVDIIYVATPHSHHFQNCMLVLEHNKPILCEKAFTVNAEQAKILYQKAKEKNLFLMEAVWTRYFPLSIAVRDTIKSGSIGEVLRVHSDLSIGSVPEEDFDVSHRMVNKDLAGGCLLDLGIYSLTWVFQTVYHTLPKEKRKAPRVIGTAMTHEPRTGADESTTMLLEFPVSTPSGKTKTHAVATTALRLDFDFEKDSESGTPAVRIQGEKGEIQVYGPIYRPQRFRVVYKKSENKPVEDRKFEFPGGGHGMFWEADEAARCFAAGKLESEGITWEESTVIMEVMDEVRRQGGLTYPEAIESTKYPVDLRAKGN